MPDRFTTYVCGGESRTHRDPTIAALDAAHPGTLTDEGIVTLPPDSPARLAWRAGTRARHVSRLAVPDRTRKRTAAKPSVPGR